MQCSLADLLLLLLLLCIFTTRTFSIPFPSSVGSELAKLSNYASSPIVPPSDASQPLFPVQAPSPMMPFTYSGIPTLSGECMLNFSAADSILRTTATDCWSSLAPYLANVVCCPQYETSIMVLIGQLSKTTGELSLNKTHAKHCLSDMGHVLESHGANVNLNEICSLDSENLAQNSCPVANVEEFESMVDQSSLLSACGNIDPATECCSQLCQNAVSVAAEKLAMRNNVTANMSNGNPLLPSNSSIVNDCRIIVFRWLASRLNPPSADKLLRGLFSCHINKDCPLVFPEFKSVTNDCGGASTSLTSCCQSMKSYMTSLQNQSFITNLQAVNCAASLGLKLQNANVTRNIYHLCHVKLKDFSLQVDSKESGCLLPSLPSDVTYDAVSGVTFVCDLNNNVAAPWPSSAANFLAPSCNSSALLPELPKATSSNNGHFSRMQRFALLVTSYIIVMEFI